MNGSTAAGPVDWDRLAAAAMAVRRHAYAPYSGFAVGAAVLDADGAVAVGVNVENAAYPLTSCAERNAVAAAVAAGARRLAAAAVAAAGTVAPCGGCLQVLSEFGDFPVMVVDVNSGRRQWRWLHEWLPYPFRGAKEAAGDGGRD